MMFRSRTFAAAAAVWLALPIAALAENPFEGERIEWTIPYGQGGGTDVWARFLAPHLSANLPGNPVVVIKNVPGGGATIGANQFAKRADDNGLEIIGTSASNQITFLLDDPRVQYDYGDWTALLASPIGMACAVLPNLDIKGPQDVAKLLQVADLRYGSQGATTIDMVPLLAMDLLGLKVKAVHGLKSRGEGRLGFERGEFQIDCQTTGAWNSKMKPLIEAGKAIPVFSLGFMNDAGEIKRDPAFPDLPTVLEVYQTLHGKAPEGDGWAAYRAVFLASFAGQKMIFVPKKTPHDVVKIYREALAKAVENPEFRKAAAEEIGDYPQAIGETAAGLLRAALDVPPAAKTWLKTWLTENHSVKF